jgi:GWxTD domain-containing protein
MLLPLCLLLTGCALEPRTFMDVLLDDYGPILSSTQVDSLKLLSTESGVRTFFDQYWHEVDSTTGSPEGEARAEYLQRLEYANEHFPDRRGCGRSDRKRIYLQYGPPRSITRSEFTNFQLGTATSIRSMEIWLYLEPQRGHSFPSVGDEIYRYEMKFIFGDLTGTGNYQLLYSGNDPSDIDSRMYYH